jgi:hypothetical protein
VYDRYTKEFIQDLEYQIIWDGSITASDDSTVFEFERNTHTLLFRNIYTNQISDSFKIPNTPNVWTYDVGVKPAFSYKGRYFAFHFSEKLDGDKNYFLLYDRQAKEIIMQKNSGLNYCFFNTSNHLAYGEVIKLEGDDKPYSYIRIYDPDQRKVIRDIKVGGEENGVANLTIRNDDKFFLYMLWNTNNTLLFYNFEQNKVSDFVISPMNSILLSYDLVLVTKAMAGYTFDWGVVGVKDNNTNTSDSVIYPNPTTNSIALNVEPKYFNGLWKLTDLNGAIMLQGNILSKQQLEINLGVLPAQNYYLRLQKDNYTVTYNIIKL